MGCFMAEEGLEETVEIEEETVVEEATVEVPDEEVSEIHEQAEALDNTLLQLAKKDENEGKGNVNGHRGVNKSHGRLTVQEAKEKEEKNRQWRKAIMDAQARIEEINQELAKLRGEIRQLEKEIKTLKSEIEQLEEKIANDEKALEEVFGPDWREKARKGELDGNARYQEWLLHKQLLTGKQHELGDKEEHLTRLKEKQQKLEQEKTELKGKVSEIQQAVNEQKITPEEGTKLVKAAVKEGGAELSAYLRISEDVPSELRQVGIENNTNETLQTIESSVEQDAGSLDFLSGASLAGNLDGDATYNQGIESANGPIPINKHFVAAVNPPPETNTIDNSLMQESTVEFTVKV